MPEAKVVKAAPVVNALRITLIMLLALYGLFFVAGAIAFLKLILPPFAFKPIPGLLPEIKFVLDKVLTGPVYFFVAYRIFKLIALVSRGEPFSQASPRHIRAIGYAVFVLALLHAAAAAISESGSSVIQYPDPLIRAAYSGLSAALVGFGFLVIARVIEVGVALKRDQDLTI